MECDILKPLSFYLLTDTHFFEPSLGASGSKYDEYMRREQMCLAENSAIVRATFDRIAEDKDTDIVIIPGDLSKDGEMESHKSFIRELERLRAAGKKVYVITARHDYNDHPRGYRGDEYVPVEGTKREELYTLYYEYGFSDAVAVDMPSMSYVAELEPGVRMLALNCDGDDEKKGYFDERLLEWIKTQIDEAKKNGDFVFAINHYPILPPSSLFELVGDARIKDWQRVSAFFADCGVPLAFTGHMHIQSINKIVTEKGNPFYDVCTSALVGSPAMYRRVTLKSEREVEIKSLSIPDFNYDMQGLTTKEYMDRQFDRMITVILEAMRDDYEYFLHRVGVKPNKKLKTPVTLAGKFLNSVSLGSIGRLMWIRVDKSIRKRLLKDFAVSLIRNLFAGDQPYVEGTAEYAMMEKFIKRIGFVLKKIDKKLAKDDYKPEMRRILLETIGNGSGIPDNDAVLDIGS